MMINEINYSWTIRLNLNQVEIFKKFLNNEKLNQLKNDNSLYEVSMYE